MHMLEQFPFVPPTFPLSSTA